MKATPKATTRATAVAVSRPALQSTQQKREPGKQHEPAERPDAGARRDGIAEDEGQGRDDGGRDGSASRPG